MIIKYCDTNENRIKWQHRRGGEWKTAELDELIEAYEREKTGKWIDGEKEEGACCIIYTEQMCSICGFSHSYPMKYKYCPNCGARMVD